MQFHHGSTSISHPDDRTVGVKFLMEHITKIGHTQIQLRIVSVHHCALTTASSDPGQG